MYRVVVTGGRDLPEAEIVWLPLWYLLHDREAIIVTHGDCPSGADLYAKEWCELPGQAWNRERLRYERKVEYLAIEDPYPADWDKLGKSAGSVRNQAMVDLAPDSVFAFPTPKSSGTFDCMARAWVRGIPVYVWHHLKVGSHHLLTDEEGQKLAKAKLGIRYD